MARPFVVLIGDDQVSQGSMIVKPNARKVRKLAEGIVCGFAGGTADALTLFERLELKLEEHPGQLLRACVELAKLWRTEKYLRHLEATMIVADATSMFTLTGNGDVIEPDDGMIGIGSGGMFALAAAKALKDSSMTAEEVGRRSMLIASEMCVYTNSNFVVEVLNAPAPTDSSTSSHN